MGDVVNMVCLILLSALAIHITGSLVTLCILLCREFFVWDISEHKPVEIKTLVVLSFCVGWLYTIDMAVHAIHRLFSNFLSKRK